MKKKLCKSNVVRKNKKCLVYVHVLSAEGQTRQGVGTCLGIVAVS